MKRFWISWEQHTNDFRPIQAPPQPESIKAWWNSGSTANGHATLCAIVDEQNEDLAKAAVTVAWEAAEGEVGEFRFVEEKPDDWLPGDRFPITHDWERERLDLLK